MESNELSPEKSLQLISDMISKSRTDLSKTTGKPFLIWGFCVLTTSLLVWITWSQTGNPKWNLLWYAMIVAGGGLSLLLQRKRSKRGEKRTARTFIGSAIDTTWILFGCISCSVAVINIFVAIPVLLYILLLMGFATALTGSLLKRPAIIACGVASILVCIPLGAGFWNMGPDSTLAMSLSALISLVIPGFILNGKSSKTPQNV